MIDHDNKTIIIIVVTSDDNDHKDKNHDDKNYKPIFHDLHCSIRFIKITKEHAKIDRKVFKTH